MVLMMEAALRQGFLRGCFLCVRGIGLLILCVFIVFPVNAQTFYDPWKDPALNLDPPEPPTEERLLELEKQAENTQLIKELFAEAYYYEVLYPAGVNTMQVFKTKCQQLAHGYLCRVMARRKRAERDFYELIEKKENGRIAGLHDLYALRNLYPLAAPNYAPEDPICQKVVHHLEVRMDDYRDVRGNIDYCNDIRRELADMAKEGRCMVKDLEKSKKYIGGKNYCPVFNN